MIPQLDWMLEDAQRLVECRHDHPFSVLGPQPRPGGGWVVRVWMPEAEQVELLVGGVPQPMATPHHPWIHEADLNNDPGCGYRLRVRRGGIDVISSGFAMRTKNSDADLAAIKQTTSASLLRFSSKARGRKFHHFGNLL